jgi:hypothetical protein
MSKSAMAFLILFLVLLVTFFVMLFMGLDGDPIVVPRTQL